MGCDIHMYVEYRPKEKKQEYDNRWRSFGRRINPGRCYEIFAHLASVRGEGNDPKGFPEDAGWAANDDNCIFISETPSEEYVTPEVAEGYVKNCGSSLVYDHTDKASWVTHPDWHSHSWATIAELAAAVKASEYHPHVEYEALLAAMRKLASFGNEVRVVYWFDN